MSFEDIVAQFGFKGHQQDNQHLGVPFAYTHVASLPLSTEKSPSLLLTFVEETTRANKKIQYYVIVNCTILMSHRKHKYVGCSMIELCFDACVDMRRASEKVCGSLPHFSRF